jgi:hypothetical protein
MNILLLQKKRCRGEDEYQVNFIDKKYYLHLGAGMPEYMKGNCEYSGCNFLK